MINNWDNELCYANTEVNDNMTLKPFINQP